MKTWFVVYEFEDQSGRINKGSEFIEANDANGLRAQINALKFDHGRNFGSSNGELIITTITPV